MEKQQGAVVDFMDDHNSISSGSASSLLSSSVSDCEKYYLYDDYGEDLSFLMSSSDEENELNQDVDSCFSFLNSPPRQQEINNGELIFDSRSDNNTEDQLVTEVSAPMVDAKDSDERVEPCIFPIKVLMNVWSRQPNLDDNMFREAASQNHPSRKSDDSNVIPIFQGSDYDDNYTMSVFHADKPYEEPVGQNSHKEKILKKHKFSRSVSLQEFFTQCKDDQSVVYPTYLEKLKTSLNSDELGFVMDLVYSSVGGHPTCYSLTSCNYRKMLQYCEENCSWFNYQDNGQETLTHFPNLSDSDFYSKPLNCSIKRFDQLEI